MSSKSHKQELESLNEGPQTETNLLTLKSESKTITTARVFYKQEELVIKKELKSLQRYSKSYLRLVFALIASTVFSSLGPLANQKYIQTKLFGEPSDLATVDLFSGIMSSISPIFGYFVDNFYPFKKRIGPYLVIAFLLGSMSQFSIWALRQSKRSFIVAISLYAASNTFTAVLVQGLLVLKTKLDVKIFDLKEDLRYLKKHQKGRDKASRLSTAGLQHNATRDSIGIRLYTLYSIYTLFLEGFSSVLSGYLIDHIPVEQVYLISALPGVFLILFIFIAFREPTEKKRFAEGGKLVETLKQFGAVFFQPMLFLPIALKLLTKMVPDTTEAIKFILINKGGWSYSKFGQVSAINVFALTFVLIGLQRVPMKASSNCCF